MTEPRRNPLDKMSIFLANKMERSHQQTLVKRSILVFNAVSLRTFAVLFAISAFWGLAPHLETMYLGVITDWRGTQYQRMADNNWQFEVYGYKPWYRANCESLGTGTMNVIVRPPDETAYAGTLTPVEAITPGTTRPSFPEEQSFGEWRLRSVPPAPPLSRVYGRIRHDCGLPWITVTNVGPFTLPLIPKAPTVNTP